MVVVVRFGPMWVNSMQPDAVRYGSMRSDAADAVISRTVYHYLTFSICNLHWVFIM